MGCFRRQLAHPWTEARRAAIPGFAALLFVTWGFVACSEPQARSTDWPPGAWLVARTGALEDLLSRLEGFEGTLLAARIRDLRAQNFPAEHSGAQYFGVQRGERGRFGCDVVAGGGADLTELLADLGCDPGPDRSSGVLTRLEAERRGRDIAFVWSPSDGEPVLGSLSVGPDGGVELEVRIPGSFFAGARALLRPGFAEPGPSILSAAESLIRVRLRPEGGLSIADWVPRGSQADRLFRLKSALFAGLVLDGTWEAAVYLPEPGHPMPRAALAVGFVRRHSAVAAMEGFLGDLSTQWPVHRSAFSVDDAPGACLLDLNLLPDLAPCYVATDAALVVGWNPASLRKALDGRERGGIPNVGGAVVDFGRFAEADARLADDRPIETAGARPSVPWQRVVARGRRVGDDVQLNVTFESGPGA